MFAPSCWGAQLPQGPSCVSWNEKIFGAYVGTVRSDGTNDLHICRFNRNDLTAPEFVYDLRNAASNALQLPFDPNSHLSPSIGVDWSGRVYVTANNWVDNRLKLVKSNTNGQLSGWVNEELNLADRPGSGQIVYVKFLQFANGGLGMFSRRRKNPNPGGTDNPARTIFQYKAPGSDVWVSRGIIFNGADGIPESVYSCGSCVGPGDRLHYFGVWDWGTSGGQDFLIDDHSYVYSDDYGATWRARSGTLMTLPITHTGASGIAARTGISFGTTASPDDGGTNNLYYNSAGIDENGEPVGFLQCRTTAHGYSAGYYMIRYNPTTSTWYTDNFSRVRYGNHRQLIHWRGGLWIVARKGTSQTYPDRIVIEQRNSPNTILTLGHSVPVGFMPWVNEVGVRDFDLIEMIIPREDGTPICYSVGNGAKIR